MTDRLILTVIIMAVAVVLTLLAVRRYPLKTVRQRVDCPVLNTPARVSFVRHEVSFGNLAITDVATCSIFPNELITCDKRCMR